MTTRTPSMVMEVSAIARQHDLAPPGRRRRDRRPRWHQHAEQRHDIDIGAGPSRQEKRSAVRSISRWPRRKASTLPGSVASDFADGGRDGILDRQSRCALVHGGSGQALRPALSITGASSISAAPRARRRSWPTSRRAAGLAAAPTHVERQREAEIAVKRAFVELVEQHGGHACQFRIVEDHAGQEFPR